MLRRLLNRLLGPPRELAARAQFSPAVADEPPCTQDEQALQHELESYGLTRLVPATRQACGNCGGITGTLIIRKISEGHYEFRHPGTCP